MFDDLHDTGGTQAQFVVCDTPTKKPDHVSKHSAYWYTEEYLIRRSNHWGQYQASGLKPVNWSVYHKANYRKINKGTMLIYDAPITAKVKWSDMKPFKPKPKATWAAYRAFMI